MLSIREFSEMCHLSRQALRFYHAEGLLVPAAVDARTGYRSYAFEQVEQAMMITLLRDTGMSVKLVRQALEEPDQAGALLERHSDEVRRERAAQDEALRAARAVFAARAEPQERHVPASTVVAKLVRGTPPGRTPQEWDQTESTIGAATASLLEAVRNAGAKCVGPASRTLTRDTGDRAGSVVDSDGPCWIVEVPVDGAAAALTGLPADLLVRERDARDEVFIFTPGRNTMAKYGTVILRLLNALPMDGDRFVNIARLCQEVHEDGVLSSAPVERRPD